MRYPSPLRGSQAEGNGSAIAVPPTSPTATPTEASQMRINPISLAVSSPGRQLSGSARVGDQPPGAQELVEAPGAELLVTGAQAGVLVADEAALDAVAADESVAGIGSGGATGARLELGLQEIEEQLGIGGLAGLHASAGRNVHGDAMVDAHIATGQRAAALGTGSDLDTGVERAAIGALAAALELVQALLGFEQAVERSALEEPRALDRTGGIVDASQERGLDAAALGPARVHPLEELGGVGGVAAGADALHAQEHIAAVVGLLGGEAVLDV